MTSPNLIEQYLVIEDAIEQFFEGALGGITIIGADYKIEYVNDRVCEILGLSRDEIINQDFRRFLHQDSLGVLSERYEKRLQGHANRQTYEAKIIDSQNCSIDVQIRSTILKTKGNEFKILGQIIDITRDRRIEEALCKSEHLYQTLVSTMNEGLGIIDDDGILTFANEALCMMLDYDENELLGKPTTEILHGSDKNEVLERIQQRIAGKNVRYEATLIHKSGKMIPARISASPHVCYTGKCTGTCVVFTDITKEKIAEKQLQTTKNRALLYLDLMKHDIRNYLQEIQVSSELLRFKNQDPSTHELVENILNAILKSTKIIAESRTIEQLADIPLRERLLDAVVRESVKDVSILLDDLLIELSIDVTRAYVRADEYLEVLLSDLLSNAYIHNHNDIKRVWVNLTANHDMYELLISDNGPGIPENVRSNLPKPGSRFGIGLHLTYHIVEKYGGAIEISDRVVGDSSQGTTIKIVFPILSKSF